jgi:hypothetical protein
MLNCQQVTRLIEIRADQQLSWGTLLAMRVHLRLCFLCRRYESQTALITRLARKPAVEGPLRLRDDFKNKLQEELRRRAAESGMGPATDTVE